MDMDEHPHTGDLLPGDALFTGGGEMGALVRSHDWSRTPLGPVETWPQSLKTTVRILLTSRFSMWMGWGPDLTFLYNDAYQRDTLGKKHPWALGRPARTVWAEIWDDISPRIQRVLETGEATWDEALLLFLERSGYAEETYHTFSYSPLTDDQGRTAGLFCVVMEETERVIGERRLAILRELASELATTTSETEVLAAIDRCVGLSQKDLPFTLIYLFEEGGTLARLACCTGIERGDAAAPAVIDVAAPDAVWPALELLRQAGSVVVSGIDERFGALPTGAWDRSPRQAVVVPIARQGQEEPSGFMVAGLNPYRPFEAAYAGFMDLVAGQIAASLANASAYEEERRRAEALAELDRAKTVFFTNISHELRTPLTLMLGPAEDALSDAETIPGNRERLTVIHRNAQRLLRLVNSLLDFSRIEAGRVQASYEATDLATYTAELASTFRSAAERAGLAFVVDTAPLPEPVHVDREMWEKIFFNLLSNAFKYTLQGEIAVSLRRVDGVAELEVRDTGVGIPMEELPHVFERFHRVEGARGRTHEGTGIGLALVQELVKLHGGTVSVESTPGEGTTFRVRVPIGTAHLPKERIGAVREIASTATGSASYVGEALRGPGLVGYL
jgi:signal transduction histidine kinase